MKFVDYYDVLGVAQDASEDEIKQTYRKLARKFHPDVNKEPDAEKKFKEVAEAYEVLKDPEKRAEFDELRKWGGRSGEEFRPPPGWQSGAGFGGGGYTAADAADFSDFFSEIFGGASASGRPGWRSRGGGVSMPGEDYTYRVEVDVEEAFSGGSRTLTLKSPERTAPGAPPTQRTLTVKIPKGVTEGQKIRLKGQGGPGIGEGPAGDLYLEIHLSSQGKYAVDGKNVTLVLPVTPWEAVLGASVEVPTLGGAVHLSIPKGARSGQKMRLKGRGLPGDPPGDQFVILEIVVPPHVNDEQRKLFEELRDKTHFNPRVHLS